MLTRAHVSFGSTPRGRVTQPDLSLLVDVVSPKVLDALRIASDALKAAGVRHVVVGGLAVGANGYPRATKDVDFLVGDEAFERHAGGLVMMRPGIPIQVNGVAIDLLSIGEGEEHLATALASEPGVPIDAPRLVYMKLKAGRQKDRADVVELLKAGTDIDAVRTYLQTHAPQYLVAFETITRQAAEEE